MFKPDDIVQSKTGGPKMRVLDVKGDTLFCARIDDAEKKRFRYPRNRSISITKRGILAFADGGDLITATAIC